MQLQPVKKGIMSCRRRKYNVLLSFMCMVFTSTSSAITMFRAETDEIATWHSKIQAVTE
jgi:hypothetical protein